VSGKYRNLTTDEVAALPFDMRLCFEYVGWNINAGFATPDDWQERFASWVSPEVRDLIKFASRLHAGEVR
jgi:hypothetical protein